MTDRFSREGLIVEHVAEKMESDLVSTILENLVSFCKMCPK